MVGRITVAVLAGLVLVSAFGVVYSRHESRKLFVALQEMQEQRDEMNVDWGRLQIEQSTWATHGRVADIARNKLGMIVPTTDDVRIIRK